MMKTVTSLLVASAFAFAPAVATAAPKKDRMEVSLLSNGFVVEFANRGACQSGVAKLRNGVRGLFPTGGSAVNALAKPIRGAVCQKRDNGLIGFVVDFDKIDIPGVEGDEEVRIEREILAFVSDFATK